MYSKMFRSTFLGGGEDASRTEDEPQKKIAKYPIGRTQLASVRSTKPTEVEGMETRNFVLVSM